MDHLVASLASRIRRDTGPERLRWLRVSVGSQLRLVAVDEVDYLRSEDKYTVVSWRDEAGAGHQGAIRTPLKDIEALLDPLNFARIHRAVVVNLRSVAHVTREAQGTGILQVKNRADTLPVSRSCMPLFRQM